MAWTYWGGIGAILAGLAVGLGAFGAHGLKKIIAPEMLAVFETGVRYQMYHALALLAVSAAMTRIDHPSLKVAAFAFVLGSVLFSGSLYGLALSGPRWLGPVTPLGGLAFVSGWIAFAVAMFRPGS